MDYRTILKKYMRHVGEQEGIYFLPDEVTDPENTLTPGERQVLREVARELNNRGVDHDHQ
jgi:FixJ family two-component response regulator